MSYKILGISLILMLFLKILITSKLLWFFFFTILCYKFPSSWLSYHLLKFVRNIRLAQQWSPQKRDGKYCLKIIASTSSWSTRLFILFQCLATIANDAMANNQCCTQFCVYDFDLNSGYIWDQKIGVDKRKKGLQVYHKKIYSVSLDY